LDWKKLSKKLVDLHEEKEAAIIRLTPATIGEVINLSSDGFCLEVEGKKLSPKKVRKFLWENRKKRALQRKQAVLWSAYMEEEDKSYVGVGALTSPKVAARIRGE
tara:strand:- start:535 stop:849 length:315 start_codon:yes stop_codon:yes gene_type:complete